MQPSVFVVNVGLLPAQPKSIRANASFGLLGALLCLLSLSPAWGQLAPSDSNAVPAGQAQPGQGTVTLPTVYVTGYKPVPKSELSNDPAANPASVTVFDYSDEKKRSIRDYADLLKPITGVAANNFDQGGVGFGYSLRGFSERSNGGNAAVFIDGVPVNLSSHTLTNGYADLTPLIPELVDRFVLTRGPFDVRVGAHALGGSLQITTRDRPPSGAVLTGGSFDFGRGLGVFTSGSGAVTGYVSLLGSTTSGYRDNADLDQINTFNKILFPMAGGTGSVRLQIYSNDYNAPGFIRRDLVENGTLSPRAAVNPTDGGNTGLQNLVFNYREKSDQPFTANAYIVHTDSERFSTRLATVPVSPNDPRQFLQTDDRVTFGGALEKYFRRDFAHSMSADLLVGAGVRTDIAESTQFNTVARSRRAQTENTDFTLANPFGYAQVNFKPVSWLKLTAGFRYDHLFFDIEDRTRKLNVSPDLGVTQAKAGIVVSPVKGLDFFANYGEGFLPPSAIAGQLSRNPGLEESKLETKEIGVQYNSPDGVWHFLGSAYWTEFTNEIFNQPPPLLPISLGPSRRDGYDVEAAVRVYQDGPRALSIFASYSKVDGELVGRTTPGTDIPDIADYLAKYGFDLALPLPGKDSPHVVTLSAAQIFEGPKSLNTTGTIKTKSFSRIDANLAYTNWLWKGFSAFVGFVIYPDRRLEETAFLFGTPPTVGVSPKAPLTVQGGVFIPF